MLFSMIVVNYNSEKQIENLLGLLSKEKPYPSGNTT